jgi:hypothetical protein
MAIEPSRFSIVVPLVGDVSLFEQTLASLLRDRSSGTEVILVHDGTYEDPYSVASEVTIIDAQSRRLSSMLNQAVAAASAELIAIVRPGVELIENWQSDVAPMFADEKVASAVPLIVSLADRGEIVAAGLRTNYGFQRILEGDGDKTADRVCGRLRPIGPTHWAAFYRRSTLELAGNFDTTVDDQYLDLDIALTLKGLGYRSHFAAQCVATISRPTLITREADQPHGDSAQRAIVRHGRGESPLGRGLLSFAKEVLGTPLQPSLFLQAIGRIGALGTNVDDQKFAKRLERINRMKLSIEKSGLKVHASELATEVRFENSRLSERRAA